MDTETMIREVNAVAEKHKNDFVPTFQTNITAMCRDILPKLEKLKEYEELEEQGLLLRLPCKVGDTVYGIRKSSYCPSGICRSGKSCSECRENAPYRKYKKKFKMDDLKEIGKSIFLTEDEADEALKNVRKSITESSL